MLRGSVPSGAGSAHTFSKAPQAMIQRSSFNRSHGVKATFDAGYLVPILVDEMVPGDTFKLRMSAFARLATPLYPLMDNLYLESFFFFVPNRLVWDHWQAFCGEQKNPGDTTDYVIPQVVMPAGTGAAENSLADYFGIPSKVPDLSVNALPFRAYNLIFNEWFRDENLQNSLSVPTGDGPDTYSDYVLKRRGKRHDYFTSCLPFPQKGPDVLLPLGSSAPVSGDNATPISVSYLGGSTLPYQLQHGHLYINSTNRSISVPDGPLNPITGGTDLYFDNPTGLSVDLSQATLATINDLRLAFQTQRMYEKDARGGTRYVEIVRSHFGVVSPDGRLPRPEYIGGG